MILKTTDYSSLCNDISLIHDQLRSELESHQVFYEILELQDGELWRPEDIPEVVMVKLTTPRSVELYHRLLNLRIERYKLNMEQRNVNREDVGTRAEG